MVALNFLMWLIGMVVLYWVIRLAVRHALRDDRRQGPRL